MDSVISILQFILCYKEVDIWMPDEEPTFYIPSHIQLSAQQERGLLQSGVQRGQPFILASDGSLAQPSSKKYELCGMNSGIAIQIDSMLLCEEADGLFSLEFTYFTVVDVEIMLSFNVKDQSNSSRIRYVLLLFLLLLFCSCLCIQKYILIYKIDRFCSVVVSSLPSVSARQPLHGDPFCCLGCPLPV
jgi:hypothetical protein